MKIVKNYLDLEKIKDTGNFLHSPQCACTSTSLNKASWSSLILLYLLPRFQGS